MLVARLWAIPAVRKSLAVALVYVVLLNATVRYVGHGDASLLSVFYLPQKSYAVGTLALHSVTHLWSSHSEDPQAIVTAAALRCGVPPALALAVARTESGLRPHCISATGAMGLMQLMPGTALAHAVVDPFDPSQSADGGSRYLHELWQRYGGDSLRVAAAYNAGAGRVPRHGPLLGLPAETRAYVSRVLVQRQDAL